MSKKGPSNEAEIWTEIGTIKSSALFCWLVGTVILYGAHHFSLPWGTAWLSIATIYFGIIGFNIAGILAYKHSCAAAKRREQRFCAEQILAFKKIEQPEIKQRAC